MVFNVVALYNFCHHIYHLAIFGTILMPKDGCQIMVGDFSEAMKSVFNSTRSSKRGCWTSDGGLNGIKISEEPDDLNCNFWHKLFRFSWPVKHALSHFLLHQRYITVLFHKHVWFPWGWCLYFGHQIYCYVFIIRILSMFRWILHWKIQVYQHLMWE